MRKILIILLLLIACTATFGQGTVSEESLKAAFIYHFINFVEWNDSKENYYVCIPDDSALRDSVEETFQGKVVHGRKVVVTADTDTCHVLVSDHVPESPTTHTIGPLKNGALFEFRMVDHKLKFAVNSENIKKTQLKISSQLLKLAIREG